ncbi:hypothetical protein KFE98_18200 [bacterium SCSIO 12741]|nr:hypothetical protein KFE98_18200 [bacterium SCSIO 12741]
MPEGYGIYLIITAIGRWFNRTVPEIWERAALFTGSFIGWFYALIYFYHRIINAPESWMDRAFGEYGLYFWWTPISLLLASHMPWLKWVRNRPILRLLNGFWLLFSMEAWVILNTSMHRDYQTFDFWSFFLPRALNSIIGLFGFVVFTVMMSFVLKIIQPKEKA